tara:strand:- start:3100 stop:3822 length:723 start_codon:yes stop_codon:yes gene_type:complete
MNNDYTLEEFVTSQSYISRRDLLAYLKSGLVSVNGECVSNLKIKVNAKNDTIVVNGDLVQYQFPYVYYKFFKPKGVLSTMEDPKGRRCIGDFIRQLGMPIFPVGRLDKDTTGLMILTNDGDFSHKLMHPSFKCNKVYHVTLNKRVSKSTIERLNRGFFLEDGPVMFTRLSVLSDREFMLSINEGRNRLIRRTFEHFGYFVDQLKRLQIGNLDLKGMAIGDFSPLTKQEIRLLLSSLDIIR